MKRSVVIFGRSIPLVAILAAVLVVSVAAWAAWLALSGSGEFDVTYADPPQEIETVIYNEQCSIIAGAGIAGAPVLGSDPYSVACPFSLIDETSVINIRISLDNTASTIPVLYSVITPPVTDCFDVVVDPESKLLDAGAGEDMMRVTLYANTNTVDCAIANPTELIGFDFVLDPQ
jgi:hypothetical protein